MCKTRPKTRLSSEKTFPEVKDRDDFYPDDNVKGVPEDCIRIGNKLYSVEKLLGFHPGGELPISAFAGRDASQVGKGNMVHIIF